MLSALWSFEPQASDIAEQLERCGQDGALIICAPVYCELRAHPSHNEQSLQAYLHSRQIVVDWTLDHAIWALAAEQLAHHAERRRQNRIATSARLLADFLIGAHAINRTNQLFTLDANRYRTYFPKLKLVEAAPIH